MGDQASTSVAGATGPVDYTVARQKANRELHILRVADLKPLLGWYRLTKSGSKQELIDRILKMMDEKHNAGKTAERDSILKRIQDEVEKLRNPVKSQIPWSSPPQMSGSIGGGGGGKQPVKATTASSGGGGAVATGGGARSTQCICGNTAAYAVDKECSVCHKTFHSTCLGHFYRHTKDECFLCISQRQDPYHTVTETLSNLSKYSSTGAHHLGIVGQNKVDHAINFRLTHQSMTEILSSTVVQPDGSKKRSMKILLRCFPLSPQDMNKTTVKVPKYPPHCWPLETNIRVNSLDLPIKQRQVFYHGMQRKWKGVSDPVDIFQQCRAGQNRVQLSFKDDRPYVIIVQIVRKQTVDTLFQKVSAGPNNPTVDQGIARVKSSFKGSSVDNADDDDDDADLMATVTRISLRCPLGMVPIVTPSRGKSCTHLQCFDLRTFLQFNEKNSAASWKCGVCNNPLTIDELEVDNFMLDIINKLKETKSEDPDGDIDTIEIDGNGVWKPHSSTAAAASRKRKAEEASSSSSKPAETVDISDDDDDDDDNQPLAKSVRRESSGSSAPFAAPSHVRYIPNSTQPRAFPPVVFRVGGGLGATAIRPASTAVGPLQGAYRYIPSSSNYGARLATAIQTAARGASSSSASSGRANPEVIDLSLDSDEEGDNGGSSGANSSGADSSEASSSGANSSGANSSWASSSGATTAVPVTTAAATVTSNNSGRFVNDGSDTEEEDEGPRRRRVGFAARFEGAGRSSLYEGSYSDSDDESEEEDGRWPRRTASELLSRNAPPAAPTMDGQQQATGTTSSASFSSTTAPAAPSMLISGSSSSGFYPVQATALGSMPAVSNPSTAGSAASSTTQHQVVFGGAVAAAPVAAPQPWASSVPSPSFPSTHHHQQQQQQQQQPTQSLTSSSIFMPSAVGHPSNLFRAPTPVYTAQESLPPLPSLLPPLSPSGQQPSMTSLQPQCGAANP